MFPVGEGGGLAEVVAAVVEEVEDGGLLDAEPAAGPADANAGIILDKAVAADFVEQAAAFFAVDGLGTFARRLADELVPSCLEKLEGGAVGVVEKVV